MAFVKINDREFEVQNGLTILEAAKQVGIRIPHYCYHPKLSIVGSCRMCLVEVQGSPKLLTACSTRIGELPPERKIDGKYDMVVQTESETVKKARESVLEFLLLNHPLDCPECDQAGFCKLQDYSYEHGKDHSRYEFPKRVPPKKDMGPTILLYTTRCILCTRCVRFIREISGTEELIVNRRGAQAEIDIFPGRPLDNKLSMNVADICPVGALVTKDFLFKPRIWNYKKKETICTRCSKGCNTKIEYVDYENKIYRIQPRRNDQVNDTWMCDEGRLFYHEYEAMKRLTKPLMRSGETLVESNWFKVFEDRMSRLTQAKNEEILFILSPYLTLEEFYLVKKLVEQKLAGAKIVLADNYRQTEDEKFPGFVIEGQKAPNVKGFELVFGSADTLSQILPDLKNGKFSVVYYLNGDPFAEYSEELLEGLKKASFFILQDIQETPLMGIASLVLPSSGSYEKEGTYVNSRHHLQRARNILVPPGAAKTDFEILNDLYEKFDLPAPIRPQRVFDEMAKEIPALKDLNYQKISSEGIRLNVAPTVKEI